MTDIKELLKEFKHIAENGREQIDKYLAEGKKVVGVFLTTHLKKSSMQVDLFHTEYGEDKAQLIRLKNISQHSTIH